MQGDGWRHDRIALSDRWINALSCDAVRCHRDSGMGGEGTGGDERGHERRGREGRGEVAWS